jgi:hypothetical protein
MMRFPVSLSAILLAAAGVVLSGGAHAQSSSSQTPAQAPSQNPPQSEVQTVPPGTPGNGTYVVVDPLAGVRYDERWDVSLGAAYGHIKAGPPPLEQGANLGGLDLSAS